MIDTLIRESIGYHICSEALVKNDANHEGQKIVHAKQKQKQTKKLSS